MYARFDFVSPETGRVLLSTLLDAPPDQLDQKKVGSMLAELSKTKRRLESIFGVGQVRVSLESYESSVFWYLVLFRPIQFSDKHPKFAGRKYSVYDVLRSGSGIELQKTDLGLAYDRENNWLSLLWNEAMAPGGICAGMEACPSWEGILNAYKKRVGKDAPLEWWRHCAECHSWIVPEWRLHKMRYQMNKLWFRTDLTYDRLTVIDLTGIEIVRLEGEGKGLLNEAKLLTARRVRYAHHYTTSDKREFLAMRKRERELRRLAKVSEERAARQEEVLRLREQGINIAGRPRKARDNWHMAGRIVGQLCAIFRVGKAGRYPFHMKGEDAAARYRKVVDKYLNGQLLSGATQTRRVQQLLDELEKLLSDPSIPGQFTRWLRLRETFEIALARERKEL